MTVVVVVVVVVMFIVITLVFIPQTWTNVSLAHISVRRSVTISYEAATGAVVRKATH